MGSSRFKRPPGAIFGHVPDAAAKLPTTSADRSFMMATAREQANYKRLSWCRAFGSDLGFCALKRRSAVVDLSLPVRSSNSDGSLCWPVSCGALTCDSPNLLSSGVLRVLEHRVKLIRTPIEHTNCLKRHNCKKSGSEHEFGSKLQPSCLHLGRRGALHRRLAKAQLRWTRQRQQTTDATERNMKTRTARASRRRIAASQSCQRSAHAG